MRARRLRWIRALVGECIYCGDRLFESGVSFEHAIDGHPHLCGKHREKFKMYQKKQRNKNKEMSNV